MKSIILDPKPKSDILELVSIQGLYSPIKAHANFWTLKAKIELSIFQDHRNGEKEYDKT